VGPAGAGSAVGDRHGSRRRPSPRSCLAMCCCCLPQRHLHGDADLYRHDAGGCGASPTVQAYIQFIGDLVLITGLVYYLGGATSPFSLLYLIVIARRLDVATPAGRTHRGEHRVSCSTASLIVLPLLRQDSAPQPPRRKRFSGVRVGL